MNASQPSQAFRTTIRAAVTAVALASTALAAFGSTLDTRTVHQAETAGLYETFHDVPTGFVFVKLPSGWHFVDRDLEGSSHKVFVDAPTGFVFVKTSDGWRFINRDH
ncbi:hypothetical protein ASC78_01940 [Variovorax sp. Root318D1]|uniref:hypothetical protein n=1 Tax=Variovorax sp. Root318D1 TaxID=1736513 RepID=UPI0006FBA881|nr:hypothetical protein [Variovorax sp. Root318D1]KQU91708.1 hypothetical protein ASC78_01940 [Variovorax sp. Root318D1]